MKKASTFCVLLAVLVSVQAQVPVLWGTASAGGSNSSGTIFNLHSDGSNFNVAYNFGSIANDGNTPTGNLVQGPNGVLYGMTEEGGANENGMIYSYDPSTNTYADLKDFSAAGDASPWGGLVLANNGLMYGMTFGDGTGGAGNIFSLDTFGNYADLYDFSFGITTLGCLPYGTLMQASNGLLYGTTSTGGDGGDGTIFSFDPAHPANAPISLYGFTGYADGGFPYIGNYLLQGSNGLLYGMTNQGGTGTDQITDFGYGVLFSIDPTTPGSYTVLWNFDPTNATGGNPCGGLVQAGNLLYGMTNGNNNGNNSGNLFSLDTTTSNAYPFTDLLDFTMTTGDNPASINGSLNLASDGNLYGATTYDGTSGGEGEVFQYNYNTFSYNPVYNLSAVTVDGTSPFANFIELRTISTGGVSNPLCAGRAVNVHFTATGAYLLGNVFTAQLSDASGSFASPVTLGTTNSTTGGTYSINGTIPGGTASGTGYRIRVVSSGPNFTGADNGSNITINTCAPGGYSNLWGMATSGGANGLGTIFSINGDGSNFTVHNSFGPSSTGQYPYGSVLMANTGLIFGMTNSGGTNSSPYPDVNNGVIFSIDPLSNAYNAVIDFNYDAAPKGALPWGSLMQASDNRLYGMTYDGGAGLSPSNQGEFFSFDPTSPASSYTSFDFTGTTGNGANPYGTLVQSTVDSKLYGMTALGGVNGIGNIFSFDPNNSSNPPIDVQDFTGGGSDYGVSPYGSLIQAGSGNLLYGMTSFGGINGKGNIFSFDPANPGNPPVDIFDFTASAPDYGFFPWGTLTQGSGTLLYGLTYEGGTNGEGNIFSFDINTLVCTDLVDFTGVTGPNYGDFPFGSLMMASDGNLYGLTSAGGANNDGVIFQYNIGTSTYTDIRDLNTSDGITPIYTYFVEVPTIATGTVTGSPFCAGASVNVPFTITGSFNSGNIFTAQLSDASGNFGSPVSIGTLTGTAAGTISAAIPSLTPTGSGYRIRVVGSNPAVIGTDNGSNISVSSCSMVNTWLGTTNDWNLGTNWSSGSIPSCSDVEDLIPVTSNNPVISVAENASNLVINDGVTLTVNAALSVCGNLTGGSSRVATIQGTTALTLTGSALQTISGLITFQNQLALDNTLGSTPQAELASGAAVNIYDALVLQNDNTLAASLGTLTLKSTSVTQAAIIDNFSGGNSGTVTGNITAERFYGSATASNDFKQHMLGSPVSGIDLSALGSTAGSSAYYEAATGGIHNCNELLGAPGTPYGNVFSYDETHASTCTMDGWEIGAASTPASAGTGYSVVLGSGSGTLSLTGTANLNSGYTPSTTNSGYSNTTSDQGRVYSSGINLVSNPYPAVLSVSALNTANAANFSGQTIYVWNVGTGAYDMNPATIAPFQAFKVIQSAAGSKTYSIPGTARTISASTFQRTTNPIELNMTVTNNSTGLIDNTIVGFNSNSTAQFDPSFDVIKLPGALTRHTMYSLNSNYWLAINVLNSINGATSTVPVGFEPGVSGTYTTSFSGLTSFDPTSYIMLEDLQTGTMFNVRSGDYTFTSDATTDSWNRFILHFTPPASITATDATCSEQGMINIVQPGTAIWNYTLADNNNVTLSSGTLNANSPVMASVPAGIYNLTLIDNNGYTVVKTIEVNGVQPVIASFIASANTIGVNQEVILSSTAAGAIINSWSFGDGTTGNGTTVSHTYTSEGVYNVTLNSASASGCTSSASNTITVTRSVTGVTDLNDINNILIWSNENIVNVDFSQLSEVQANIEIYNILGQKLSDDKYVTSTVYRKEIPNIEEGYIVVSVKNNDGIISKKLFISNVK